MVSYRLATVVTVGNFEQQQAAHFTHKHERWLDKGVIEVSRLTILTLDYLLIRIPGQQYTVNNSVIMFVSEVEMQLLTWQTTCWGSQWWPWRWPTLSDSTSRPLLNQNGVIKRCCLFSWRVNAFMNQSYRIENSSSSLIWYETQIIDAFESRLGRRARASTWNILESRSDIVRG